VTGWETADAAGDGSTPPPKRLLVLLEYRDAPVGSAAGNVDASAIRAAGS
jgi:hypothetical protein